jgi:hypothetical protein
MKNLFVFVLGFLFLSQFAFAQNMIGISTNLNIATVSESGLDNNEGFLGIKTANFGTVGLHYQRNLDPNWTLVTGLNYSRRGAKSKIYQNITLFGEEIELGARLVHRMNYLEVPVLFQYKFNTNKSKVSPYIFFGPQFAYETGYEIAVKAHILVDINLFDYNVNISNGIFNRYDISAVAGGGLAIPIKSGEINLNASYVYGFTDLLDDPVVDFNLKHRNVRVGVAYYYDF